MVLGLPWEVLAVSPWQALGGGSPILSRGRVSSCLCPSFCKQKACGGAVLLLLSQRWKSLRLYCVVVGQLFYHGRLHCFSVFMFFSLVLSEVRSKFVWNNGLEMRESRSTQEIYWERGKLNWKKNTAPVSSIWTTTKSFFANFDMFDTSAERWIVLWLAVECKERNRNPEKHRWATPLQAIPCFCSCCVSVTELRRLFLVP